MDNAKILYEKDKEIERLKNMIEENEMNNIQNINKAKVNKINLHLINKAFRAKN